ncbi:MAG TPA: YtcA family lipoprotein [Candidatus Binatia bacterium]|nr:YtcA family lipoprotein [Candidatus Binatia bacterium]
MRCAPRAAVLVASAIGAGCDPIVSIQGAFFPAWILCIFGGLALTAVSHRVLVATGLQPHLGPIALVYPSLAIAWTMLLWLVFFRV